MSATTGSGMLTAKAAPKIRRPVSQSSGSSIALAYTPFGLSCEREMIARVPQNASTCPSVVPAAV